MEFFAHGRKMVPDRKQITRWKTVPDRKQIPLRAKSTSTVLEHLPRKPGSIETGTISGFAFPLFSVLFEGASKS